MEMARERSGSGEIFGGRGGEAGHVGRGPPLSLPEISRRPRDLVAGDAPGGEGAHLRPLRIFFRSGPSVFPFGERVPFSPFPVQGGWWLSISFVIQIKQYKIPTKFIQFLKKQQKKYSKVKISYLNFRISEIFVLFLR